MNRYGDQLVFSYCRFAIFLVLVLQLNACRNEHQPEETDNNRDDEEILQGDADFSHIKIGYSSPSLNAPFYVVLSRFIREYAQEYKMNFVMADGQDDIIKQITSMEDLISSGLDVLILNPLDHMALVPAVNAAEASGVPVFIVDSQIGQSARYITSVQASNEGNGELIGEWVVNNLDDPEIKVALISGSPGNPVGKEKRLGFVRGFVETQLLTGGNADLNIVFQGWGNWTLLGGLEAMEDILVTYPDVDLLVAENDAMGIGALKTIQESERSGNIMIVGFDGQKEAFELIKEGKFNATALNSPKELARLVIESVVKYLNGEQLEKIIHTPPVLITKENVDEYYDPQALF